jgi:hypothetical protein
MSSTSTTPQILTQPALAGIAPLRIPDDIAREAAAFRAHPRFQDAMRLKAERLLASYTGQPLLNKLVGEEARWMIGGFALFLHFTRDLDDASAGATLARIQALCTAYRQASPGRVAALVGLMCLSGHLARVTARSDRRVRRLEPTEAMLAVVREWMRAHLGPLHLLDDAIDPGALVEDPRYVPAFYREAGELFFAGSRVIEAVPGIRLFMGRDAGYMVLLRLWLAAPDGSLPPRGRLALPYEATGRQFGVSRAHVRKLMEQAAREGLVAIHEDGGRAITVLPPLIELFEQSVALQLANLARCARVAQRAVTESA